MTYQDIKDATNLIEETLMVYEGEDFYDDLRQMMIDFITSRFEFSQDAIRFAKWLVPNMEPAIEALYNDFKTKETL